MNSKLKRILPKVQKPSRYTGGEYNEIRKDKTAMDLRIALCFPDTYEIGMSNVGMRILYSVMNSPENYWCERVFAPWEDMEQEMRKENIGLYGLESGDPISGFDVLGFSLGYEIAYTTVLNMLDLSGLSLRSCNRKDLLPLVFAGGTSMCNPAPLSAFMDFMVIGEGEEVNLEVLSLIEKAKKQGWSKKFFLKECAKIEGVYVPSLYEYGYAEDGAVSTITALEDAPKEICKRIVKDFENAPFPVDTIVPSMEIVHDRVNLELFRGCIRGCRFCQAGQVYRPIRYRSADQLIEQGIQSLKNSGYQEITLSSLSTSDYPELLKLCDGLLDYCESRGLSLSLPSLRADNFSLELMQKVQKVRKSGLTFAPEAGSQRLRDAINKNVDEQEFLQTCSVAFAGGWNNIKLYFMLGLPTETDEDVIAIADLAAQVLHAWRENSPNKNRGVRITVSTSCFVPKPHTPFQWEPQVSREEYVRRVNLLREHMTAKNVTYNWHDAEMSEIEAVLSRGDARLCDVIEEVWRQGGKLEAWTEFFQYDRWIEAMHKYGLETGFYTTRERKEDEVFPWSNIFMGTTAQHLLKERHMSQEGKLSPDCSVGCLACGARKLSDGKCNEGGICGGKAKTSVQ